MNYCCKRFKQYVDAKIFIYYEGGNFFANVPKNNYGLVARDWKSRNMCSEVMYFCPFCGKKILL